MTLLQAVTETTPVMDGGGNDGDVLRRTMEHHMQWRRQIYEQGKAAMAGDPPPDRGKADSILSGTSMAMNQSRVHDGENGKNSSG